VAHAQSVSTDTYVPIAAIRFTRFPQSPGDRRRAILRGIGLLAKLRLGPIPYRALQGTFGSPLPQEVTTSRGSGVAFRRYGEQSDTFLCFLKGVKLVSTLNGARCDPRLASQGSLRSSRSAERPLHSELTRKILARTKILVMARSRRLCIALCLTVELCQEATRGDTALPGWTEPYTVHGELGLQDMRWMQPRFQQDPQSRQQWSALQSWVAVRKSEETQKNKAKLAALGVTADSLVEACYADDTCELIDSVDKLITDDAERFPTYEALSTAAQQAWLATAGFRLAVQTIWHIASHPSVPVPKRLEAARLCDQAYLIARWGRNYPERRLPEMSPAAQALFFLGVDEEARKYNRIAVDFARMLITNGWPAEKDIGPSGEEAFWLIVQHSDQDPAFQYQMLSRLGPAEGSDWQHDRAYLYDTVMLKLKGKQRYGTQLTCNGGRWEARPLEEDLSQMYGYRASVGLVPFA